MARAHGLFKPRYAATAFAVAVLATTATPVRAQAPDEAWRTIRTEHFRVTFPQHLETLGRRAADRSEWAWSELEASFISPPEGVIDVLVTDHIDVSNGYAQVVPSNRIVVHARPPVDDLSLGHLDEWLELVITHELAHIVHLDHVTNFVGRTARTLFGRVSSEWPFFPELGTPRWVTEGLATWYESRLTEAGRVRGTFAEMQIRTAALEGRFERIDQASGESPLWPGGNRPYAYGSLFFDFLLERHGEDRMAAFVDAIAGQWVPYRLDAAGQDAFGVSLTEEWREWEEELEADVAALDERLEARGPITEPEPLTSGARWALHPQVSPDGRWLAYTHADGRSDIRIELRDLGTGEVRSLGRTNGLGTFSWTPDGRVLVSQLELEDPYRAYADLWLFDPAGGERRVTRGGRLTQPAVLPGGREAIAVQEGGGTNALVRVDLESGAVTPLVSADPNVHWALPRPSPDGRWIAATRWEPDANHDLVILDARDGRLVARVTADRALDVGAWWSPDGHTLVWATDRSGILNIVSAEIDPVVGSASEARIVTNVRTGAAYPSLDPSGRWLYFSGYHVDGWEVERFPFPEDAARPAGPAVARFEAREAHPERGASDRPVEPYSAGPTLGPKYWEIAYREAVETPPVDRGGVLLPRRELLGPGLGAQTSGYDLVQRHFWSLFARGTTSGGKVEGGGSYTYRGLGTPILSLAANQIHYDGGQLLAGDTNQDTLYVLERERTLDGVITFLAPRWRRDLALSLGAGLVWEDRELWDERLTPTRAYRLNRPSSRLWEASAAVSFSSTRSHSFQMGMARGLGAFVRGRLRNQVGLPDSLVSVAGADRSFGEVFARLRGAVPLFERGFARHVLAAQLAVGVAGGPGATVGHFRVGGASGRAETLTGLELFGGSFLLFPVRGYPTASRFGRYAWSGSIEYRFPLWLVNRGFRAWPLHVDRAIGTLFVDAGHAGMNESIFSAGLGNALASVGAEVTTEILGLYDVQLRLRTGFAVPLVQATGSLLYLRVGLPF